MTEQIEFHVFGGSGSAGVTSSLVSLGRSFTAFIILLPIMYYACENDNKDALGRFKTPKTTINSSNQEKLFLYLIGLI